MESKLRVTPSGPDHMRFAAQLRHLKAELEKAREEKEMEREMERYNRPRNVPPPPPRRKIEDLPDVQVGAGGYSTNDDDAASPEELAALRRRRFMKAEGFTFSNYFKLREMGGSTGAIYDGTKGKDFQWQGAPESMIKPRKHKKHKHK
jgi:hypothetical protein